MALNKTKIEWCDITINPVKGLCPMACSYCYARRMYQRFKWSPKIYEDLGVFNDLMDKPGKKVFVGSTMELFGEWVDKSTIRDIFQIVQWRTLKQHTFIFLTKKPQNLIKWSPFPYNCWIGMTVDTMSRYSDITDTFASIEASVKFVSFEPMLDYTPPDLRYVGWVIIGGMTPYSQKTAPKPFWVRDLTDIAKSENIPVFHKDNLGMIFDADGFPKRQEFPT